MIRKDSSGNNRQLMTLLAILGGLLVICIVVSVLAAKWVMYRESEWDHDLTHGHQWLDQQLGLTDEMAAAIDAFEGDYRQQRGALLEEFNRRVTHLGELLASQDDYSSEVEHAIHSIHEVHGQLQELSIKHYYDMLSVLPPDKQGMLRELAIKALSQPE